MADVRKRKLEELEKRLDEVENVQEKQWKTTANLQRRVERLDKSSTLVLENAAEVEELYKTAEQSRDFKNLAKDTSEAVLKSLGAQLGLPYPLPELSPTEWKAISAETRAIPQHTIDQWWLLSQTLPTAIQFLSPNKTRSTKDETTQQWKRASGHFLLKLRFGMGSLTIQEVLQDSLGKALNVKHKAMREAGTETGMNIFVNRTPEELERKRQQKGEGKGANGGKGGKGGKGRGKGRGK